MSGELSETQNAILRQLKLLDPQTSFKGFPDLTNSIIQTGQQNQKQLGQTDLFFEVNYDEEHEEMRDKLLNYRKKSEQIYQVGQLLKDYQGKFVRLMTDKDRLIELIKGIKGSTSELVEKQKKMIDLSMKMKESLDYYTYHNKFSFDFPCEVGCRQMFENILQQTLSELTDGIQFFQENTTYSQSKKYLGMFQSSRSKILSFVKSFFIKLLSKQSHFMNKHLKVNINGFFETFYPKSKIKFITAYLIIFPQFATKLEQIIKSVKDNAPEEEIKFLQTKELQIYQFQLNNSNHALIGYLQKHMSQIYDQSILNFIVYYRTNFHQTLSKSQQKKDITTPKLFNQKFIQIVFILTNQYAYMCYSCKITQYERSQLLRNSITQLSKLYFEDLYRLSKQVRNKNTFQICQIICKIKEQIPLFLSNHMTEEYESYAFGCVTQPINDPQHIDFIKSLFDLYIKKFLTEMEVLCFNQLPKFQIKNSKTEVQNQIREFLLLIPKLKHCKTYAEKYLIGSLDTLVKSAKDVNSKIQSRFECYVWNIEIFSTIRDALKGIKGNLIRKQLKLDVNQSSNMIEKVKNIQRNESLFKYAQDIFNVLKTGMPVINELTMDFSKYIIEHCQALQSQFVKDILYIYAKNMIEFLQKLTEAKAISEQLVNQVCQSGNVQSLYASYVLSLQKYVKDAGILLKERETYKFKQQNTELIKELMNAVYEKLFDFMDKFYVNVSAYVNYTQTFKQIQVLQNTYKKCW